MKRSILLAFSMLAVPLAALLPTATASASSSGLVISQVYPYGGQTGATFDQPYIELFNSTNSPVSIAGDYVLAEEGTTNQWSTPDSHATALSGSLAAGHYFLVALDSASGGGPIPTPDLQDMGAFNLDNGGVVLVSGPNVTFDAPSYCPVTSSGTTVIDSVYFGASQPNTCPEATRAPFTPVHGGAEALFRAGAGCTDTGVDSSDFSEATPAPRNTASPVHVCKKDDSTTSLTVKKSGSKSHRAYEASGAVAPSDPGGKLTVKLLRKKNGRFRLVNQAKPRLDSSSAYAAKFKRPGGGACKITASFKGSPTAKPSSASKSFSC